MKTKALLVFLALVLIMQCTADKRPQKPPLATANPVEDEYFGTKISDPYRYLENLQDSSVVQWMKAQADYSRTILNSIPGRQSLIDKMKEFDSRKSSRISYVIITDNDRYFYLKTTPADETGKLFYRDGYEGMETLLYDPETYSSDTTKKFVISSISASIDGSKVAFDIAPNGSESSEMMIMDVESRKIYPEIIDRCWGASPSWLPDGGSFLYNRLQSADVHNKDREKDSKTYLHIVGTDPATDKDIFSREKYPDLGIKPEDFPIAIYDKEARYIYGILSTVDSRLDVYYAPFSELTKEKIAWRHLFKPEDQVYGFLTSDKDIYIYTPKGAPNFNILKTSVMNSDLSKAETCIPEDPHRKIKSFGLTSDGMYYTLSENGVTGNSYSSGLEKKQQKKLNCHLQLVLLT